jgi:hypothetical protein
MNKNDDPHIRATPLRNPQSARANASWLVPVVVREVRRIVIYQ